MNSQKDRWIDLYEELGVDVGADEGTLRIKLRDLEARQDDSYPPQFVAQCRRVLLDPDCRTRYNRVRAQHRAGSPTAMDFQAFMSTIQSADTRRQLSAVAEPVPAAIPPLPTRGTPVLSRNTVYLLTGYVATMLMSYIISGDSVLPGL